MKKIFTLFASMVLAIAANAQVTLVNYEGTSTLPEGVEISGTTAMKQVKINTNKTNKDCVQLANGYNAAGIYNGNAIILSTEGGFKAGDVLSVTGFFNNSDETKVSKAEVFTIDEEDKTTAIWTSEQFINGRTVAEDPTAQTWTLTQDMEKIYIGRNGGTGTNFLAISVTRIYKNLLSAKLAAVKALANCDDYAAQIAEAEGLLDTPTATEADFKAAYEALEEAVSTAINTVSVSTAKVAKAMVNGKVVIVKGAKQYNVAGQEL